MENYKLEIVRNLNRIIAPHFGVEPWDIINKDGSIPPTDARRVAYFLLYHYFQWTFHEIRVAYQRRSVSSIHDLIRTAENLKDVNTAFASKLDKCWDEVIKKWPNYDVVLID